MHRWKPINAYIDYQILFLCDVAVFASKRPEGIFKNVTPAWWGICKDKTRRVFLKGSTLPIAGK